MKVEEIDLKIKELEKLKELLLEEIPEDAAFELKIFKKYLELENVAQIATWLNDAGYRKRSMSTDKMIKYDSNDVTAIITNSKAGVRQDLKDIVQKLFKQHKKGAMRKWG